MPDKTLTEMTDDEFRAWAMNEAALTITSDVKRRVEAWVRANAPDTMTIGATRQLLTMVESIAAQALKSGFNAGTACIKAEAPQCPK